MADAKAAAIEFAAGETLDDYAFYVVDVAGAPYDLTGCDVRLTARPTADAAVTIVDWTAANGGLAVAAATGAVTLPLLASASALLAPGGYYFELAVTFASGARHVLFAGRFAVTHPIARYP